jgi:hypothetical protein
VAVRRKRKREEAHNAGWSSVGKEKERESRTIMLGRTVVVGKCGERERE